MKSHDLSSWMWGDSLSMLEQAERLKRQFFHASAADPQCWEPPIDIIENAETITIHVALPGIAPPDIVVDFDAEGMTISGVRRLPASEEAQIHRIEIPYGRFERRIVLPLAALEPATSEISHGCLILTFNKRKETP